MQDPAGLPCFAEPEVPNVAWGRRSGAADIAAWLHRSTLPLAVRCRAFLNRSLQALPDGAAADLCHRLRHAPPFEAVFFELVVGRFLQVLGAEVEHEPTGLGGVKLDWRATFPDGQVVYIEATSPAYNRAAHREHARREAMHAIIADAMPAGWWVAPMRLPRLGLHEARGEFRETVRSMLASLPIGSSHSIADPLRLEALTAHGQIELRVWPGKDGKPKRSPIATASYGAHYDDSSLRVNVAAKAKRHQARAFPGEVVLLAIDAPFEGPDLEDFDDALFGHIVYLIGEEAGISGARFRPDGALATQRIAEYAGVMAFGRVSMFGVGDPTLYHHPRSVGSLPAQLLTLRHRTLEGGAIRNVPAVQTGIADGIGFPSADDE